MVRFINNAALLVWISATITATHAFTAPSSTTRIPQRFSATSLSASSRNNEASGTKLNMVATAPAMDVELETLLIEQKQKEEAAAAAEEKKIATPTIDTTGIAMSGLNGKALNLTPADFPRASALKKAIPRDCFEIDTKKSLGYLSVSVAGTALCTAMGVMLAKLVGTSSWKTLPIWTAYSGVTGTVAMGLWVLAHECGHGAFSKNRKLQDAVGFTIHSIMMVPYFSWQRSHAVHHKFTNHMELGETHVPEKIEYEENENGEKVYGGSMKLRANFQKWFGKKSGLNAYGALQGFLHLLLGWPAYLLIGATGSPDRGLTNHFLPNPMTKPNRPNKELFPGIWKKKVLQSGGGVAVAFAAAAMWVKRRGFAEVMAFYGGPLIVVNAWLVVYTWLQHTDVDVPHFSDGDHNYVKGALHTIDRPYDKLDPWGAIDFLHHKIGTTHVTHHFDCTIPHYNAEKATNAIIEKFPEIYLYEPTPIPQALWRVCKGCVAMEKRGEKWVWKNNGLVHALQHKL